MSSDPRRPPERWPDGSDGFGSGADRSEEEDDRYDDDAGWPGGDADPSLVAGPLEAPEGFRSGFVALVGRPNVGKSTLVNSVLGRKVSITAEKPQTTRHRVAGVRSASEYQLILLDIPGFQKPIDPLTRRMQDLVDATIEEVDAVLFLLDGSQRIGAGDRYIGRALSAAKTPLVMAVNKVDLLDDDRRRYALEEARSLVPGTEPLPVSALAGNGVAELVDTLAALLPEGPRYFPPGAVTDQPEETLIAEFVREKLIAVTEQEIPHSIAVQVLEMEQRDESDMMYVRAAIYVERDSQRPIVLGRRGESLKRVGTEARRDIEWLLGQRVYLDLVVKVRKHWRKSPRMLDDLGL
jgi:GTP-binding protein Era